MIATIVLPKSSLLAFIKASLASTSSSRPNRQLPPATQIKLIEPRRPRDRQRNQLPNGRIIQARHIQRHQFDDPRFDLATPGISASPSAITSGARFTLANTSANRYRS